MIRGPVRLLALALALALLAGCARVGPPTGGPEDSTPPDIVATVPAEGATSVGLDTEIRIEFSEEMARVAAERAFSIEPDVALRNLRWEGSTMVARPVDGLPDSTTFTVRVAEGASDYHGVTLVSAFALLFSTGESLDSGLISGTVTMQGEGLAGATVWACQRPLTAEDGVIRPCDRAATTRGDGTFRIPGVAISEQPYRLLAFIDENEDDIYSVRLETGRIADVAALIDRAGAVAEGIQIDLSHDPEDGLSSGAGEEE